MHVSDDLVKEWTTYFDKEVCGGPLANHMRVAFGAEVAKRCAEEHWTTESNQIPINFKMVLEILTCNPYFTCFPHYGERLMIAIVKWI